MEMKLIEIITSSFQSYYNGLSEPIPRAYTRRMRVAICAYRKISTEITNIV